jgi:hypothetical protein
MRVADQGFIAINLLFISAAILRRRKAHDADEFNWRRGLFLFRFPIRSQAYEFDRARRNFEELLSNILNSVTSIFISSTSIV